MGPTPKISANLSSSNSILDGSIVSNSIQRVDSSSRTEGSASMTESVKIIKQIEAVQSKHKNITDAYLQNISGRSSNSVNNDNEEIVEEEHLQPTPKISANLSSSNSTLDGSIVSNNIQGVDSSSRTEGSTSMTESA